MIKEVIVVEGKDDVAAVKKAVDDGEISQSRHQSYIQMYNDVKDIKEWEMK